MRPAQLAFKAGAANTAHFRAARRVCQQLQNLFGHIHRIVGLGIQRGFLRRKPPFRHVKLHNGLTHRHIFHDFIHGRFVVHRVHAVGVHAHIHGGQHLEQVLVGRAARKGDVILQLALTRQRLEPFEAGATAHKAELHIMPVKLVDDMLNRIDQQVDAFLIAHNANIAHHEGAAIFPAGHRVHLLQVVEIRPGPHHKHALILHATTLHRNFAIALVGGDGNGRAFKGDPFKKAHRLPEEAALVELGLIQLGVDVVVVENILHAQQAELPSDKEDEIRRIATLNDINAAREKDLPRQHRFPEQRRAIFGQIAQRPTGIERQRVAIDMHTLNQFIALFIALARGANDADSCAGGHQRAGFLPHAPVKRQRQVFHHDEHALAGQGLAVNMGGKIAGRLALPCASRCGWQDACLCHAELSHKLRIAMG